MPEHIILSLLIWVPIIGGIIALFMNNEKNSNPARWFALTITTASLLLCIPLYWYFDVNTVAMQFEEKYLWVPVYSIYYRLGVDGISLPMVILTTLTTLVVVLSSWRTIHTKVSEYLGAFLIMQGMMVGMFCALDSILFYIFWEGMLIPIYISIGVWGSENRSYASIKFFLYTFAGSALLLIALLYLYNQSNSFYILDYYPLHLTLDEQIWIFFAFLLAFAVKVPMWPLHTWLPDAHTEAPAGGSVVLAALMLKMGVYGFFRFTMPITPDAAHELQYFMIVLSLIAIVYIGLVAIAQTDMKKLIAYSSIAHMGFATLGAFMVYNIVSRTGNLSDAYMSLEGAMAQMLSHAFSTGAMFVGIGILYEQIHSRQIKDFGGVVNTMPVFAALFMIFTMANIGLPGTSGFVGEFLVILSAVPANFWIAVVAASTLIFSAAYTLWLYKRVFFGAVASPEIATLTDVRGFDKTALFILAFVVLFFGVYPKPLFDVFRVSVQHLLEISLQSKL